MEYELMRVREFIESNWALWEAQCAENGDDPDQLLSELHPEKD